jgi:hypothetical protein
MTAESQLTPLELSIYRLGKKEGRNEVIRQLQELLGIQELIDKALEQRTDD